MFVVHSLLLLNFLFSQLIGLMDCRKHMMIEEVIRCLLNLIMLVFLNHLLFWDVGSWTRVHLLLYNVICNFFTFAPKEFIVSMVPFSHYHPKTITVMLTKIDLRPLCVSKLKLHNFLLLFIHLLQPTLFLIKCLLLILTICQNHFIYLNSEMILISINQLTNFLQLSQNWNLGTDFTSKFNISHQLWFISLLVTNSIMMFTASLLPLLI